MEDDTAKCENNRTRSLLNMRQRLQTDARFRDKNRAMARVQTKQRLLVNKVYREQNRARARLLTKQRLLENVSREQNRARARLLMQRRRSKDSIYRQQCVEWAKAARKARLQQKGEYWTKDCNAATIRKRLARSSQPRQRVYSQYTARQLYWIKRR